jgi:ArsR family transcriptional regulator
MELFFAALADRTRLRLLNLMAMDEICVCFFVETLGASQPKISRHRAGGGAARREVEPLPAGGARERKGGARV